MREYTQSSSSRAGLGCFVEKKYHVKRLGTSLHGQTRVLSVGLDARVQGRAMCTRRGARRSSSRRRLEFSESENLTAKSHEQKTNDPSTISAQEASFDFAWMISFFATRPKSEAQNRIRIIISPTCTSAIRTGSVDFIKS